MSYAKYFVVERALNDFDFKVSELENNLEFAIAFLAFVAKKENLELSLSVGEILQQNCPAFIKDYFQTYGERFLEQNLLPFKKVSPEDLEKFIIEKIDEQNHRGFNETLPESLNLLCASLLNIKDGDNVLDMGTGIASFLIYACGASKGAMFTGIELDEKICFHANMRAYLHGCAISILHDDIFNPEFQTKYDKVITFPSFNVRVQDKKILQYTQEKVGAALNNTLYENSFILRAVDFLAENGKAVIFLLQGFLFGDAFSIVRKYLIENRLLETVISLPPGGLESTQVNTAILVLSHNNDEAHFVDASSVHSLSRRGGSCISNEDAMSILSLTGTESEISKAVSYQKIAENEYSFDPSVYLFEAKIPIKMPCSYKPLGELVTRKISRGVQYKSSDLSKLFTQEQTDFFYISAKDIKDNYIEENLQNLTGIDEKGLQYALEDDDIVLLMALTDSLKVAHVNLREGQKIIPASNLYVIRLDKSVIEPLFLKILLETEIANKIFRKFGVGMAIQSISAEFLNKVLIPVPSKEAQLSLIEKYKSLEREEISLKNRIKEITKEKRELL